MTGSNYNDPSSPLFKCMHILKLKDIHNLHVEQFIYEFVNIMLPSPLLSIFECQSDTHEYNEGYRQCLMWHTRKYKNVETLNRLYNPLLYPKYIYTCIYFLNKISTYMYLPKFNCCRVHAMYCTGCPKKTNNEQL